MGLSFFTDSSDSTRSKTEQGKTSQIKWTKVILCAGTVLEFNHKLLSPFSSWNRTEICYWISRGRGWQLIVTALYYPKFSTGIKKIEKYWHLPLAQMQFLCHRNLYLSFSFDFPFFPSCALKWFQNAEGTSAHNSVTERQTRCFPTSLMAECSFGSRYYAQCP